jgi:predicted CXXCH cytochrome family protein
MIRPRQFGCTGVPACSGRTGIGLVAMLVLTACGPSGDRAAKSAPPPAQVAAPAFADEARCAGCHPAEHAAWSGSHHDLAMQAPSESSVAGDFDAAEFDGAGVRARFLRRDGAFLVHTAGEDGVPADFPVRYVFGVDPLQQVLLPLSRGRLQAFSVAWDAREASRGGQRWYALYPDAPPPAGDALHWTGSRQRWNWQCAECHATDLRARYDAAGDRYDTTFARDDVGCQACHGPRADHVAWAGSGSRGPGAARAATAAGEVETCAPCHSRRHRVSAEDVHGDPFLDHFAPETLREGLYHADGQILEEVYEYGSFVQSRMHAAGVRCSDCHDPHSGDLAAEGDAVCLRCHSDAPDPRFATLAAKRYDTPDHHHHEAGSEGARCVACHMPARVYMGVDARHDHSLRVPRPDVSVEIGTPNACSGCHQDRGDAWAAAQLTRWFPDSARRAPHYGQVLAAARRGDRDAGPRLAALARDPDQPAIVRATAVELAPRFPPDGIDAAVVATADASPLVRAYAARALAGVPAPDRVIAGAPLLSDPVRAVRSEAAIALSSLPEAMLPETSRAAFRDALAEHVATQLAQRDTPEANLNLALVAERQADAARAESFYRAAIALDAAFTPAYANLAQLVARAGRSADAERLLRDGIARVPDAGDLHYGLGLVLAEAGRMDAAEAALARASALLPEHARSAYNHALALQHQGRADEALRGFERARALDPEDAGIAYALAVLHAQQGRPDAARPYAEAALRLGDARARALLDALGAEPR